MQAGVSVGKCEYLMFAINRVQELAEEALIGCVENGMIGSPAGSASKQKNNNEPWLSDSSAFAAFAALHNAGWADLQSCRTARSFRYEAGL